ncbi:MAG: hypothetical protein DIU69_12530 [Bacillota bacterium]|nr:MAG: hypothetical protein DIU69_12530 [Bacillota bacterium]
MDERLIGPSMARSLLGVRNYAVIQEMIHGDYVQGVWVGDGHRRRFVATADSWWEGYKRWRADHGLPPLVPRDRRQTNEDPVLSMTQARAELGCGREVVKKLVRDGYVKVTQDPRTRAMVAPRSEWIRGYRAYLADGRHKSGKGKVRSESPSEVQLLTQAQVMTVGVLTGMIVGYGRHPACYVCGRPLREGDRWRWFVPASFQPKPWEGPEPAFGCAEGHEGRVIEVAGMWFRIEPPGKDPVCLGRRPVDLAQVAVAD